MIGIRVDSNDTIAMGHLMRCMSIATQLKKNGMDIIFITSADCSVPLIEQNGFRCICLHNQYDQKEEETNTLIEFIKKNHIHALLLDSYEVTFQYMNAIHEVCKLIYIDDMNLFQYPADLIINYTYDADMDLYRKWNYNDQTTFLLGSSYVPLREDFMQPGVHFKEQIEDILLTTGGTDPYHMILDTIKNIRSMDLKKDSKQPLNINIMIGQFYKEKEQLERLAIADGSIHIYQNISNVCEVMHSCDIAISAGGTTLAELCACAIPTICFAIADNQLSGTKAYSKDGLMIYAGDVRNSKENVMNKICNSLELLASDAEIRSNLGKKAKMAIDGQGAARIASWIEKNT